MKSSREGIDKKVPAGSFYIKIRDESTKANINLMFSLSLTAGLFSRFREKCRANKIYVSAKCFELLLKEMRITRNQFMSEMSDICNKAGVSAKNDKGIAEKIIKEKAKNFILTCVNEKKQESLSKKMECRIKDYLGDRI